MNKYKISLILNIIIFVLVAIGTILMITGIKFMSNDLVLSVSSVEAFKFFTVDSNILMGLAALVFAYFDYLVLSKKRKEIPDIVYKIKHIATVGVILTFLVTVFYLAPFSEYSYLTFFKNSNLFFHLIVPVLGFITFAFYENNSKQNNNIVLLGMIPMVIYSIFYVIDYLVHNASKDYDWYNLIKDNPLLSIVSVTIMFVLTYLISYLLWKLNKKSHA